MPLDVHYHVSMETIDNMVMFENSILIEVFDTRNKTKSGIELPITSDNPFVPNCGIIYKKPKDFDKVNIGDEVVFEQYRGNRIYSDNGRQFLLMHTDYILAIKVNEEKE